LYELIAFDLDGTLADSKSDIATSTNIMLAGLGFPGRDPEEIYTFIGGGVHNLVRKSLPPGPESLVDEGVESFWRVYREHVMDSTRLYPGVPELLDRLGSYKLAVVTNKPLVHTELLLEGLGIRGLFGSVQGWRLGLTVKPDPEMLLTAIRETGAVREKVVMVGDGTADIFAARAADVKSCAVGYGYGERERLIEAGPDYFAESVPDIAYVINP